MGRERGRDGGKEMHTLTMVPFNEKTRGVLLSAVIYKLCTW